jgi:glycerophosphoryl diester phosphodiesterase
VPFVAKPLIIAHRGASAEAPENTLAAFQRALALHADGLELDVQITRDGVAVVFHDPGLRRLTGKSGQLTDQTWPDLQELRVLGSDQSIPRLADVLALVRRPTVVQIELKRGAALPPVLAAIKQTKTAQRVILASFEASLVREAARLAPEIPRMFISEGRYPRAVLAAQLRRCQARGLSVNHRAIRSAGFIRYFQQEGFTVWSWTVNDSRIVQRLTGWGIDALLGDNPALMQSPD